MFSLLLSNLQFALLEDLTEGKDVIKRDFRKMNERLTNLAYDPINIGCSECLLEILALSQLSFRDVDVHIGYL